LTDLQSGFDFMRQSRGTVRSPDIQLRNLASLYGIKTSYFDLNGQVISASKDTLISVLMSLGSPLSKIEDVQSAIREKRQQFWREIIDPVIVAWENQQLKINLHLPAKHLDNPISALINMEDGSHHKIRWSKEQLHIKSSTSIEGTQYISLDLNIPFKLPMGYHKIIIEINNCLTESLIISSPQKAFLPSRDTNNWGVFVPLYALHTLNSWGAGDFSDMEILMNWLLDNGANLVGTLPILPSFFDDKFGPGPYMPASRLFWNEFYLNINQIPELQSCPEAVDLLNSDDFLRQISNLRSSPIIDYDRQLDLKRKILEKLAA
jgi:4-alpha-glucanotransferase